MPQNWKRQEFIYQNFQLLRRAQVFRIFRCILFRWFYIYSCFEKGCLTKGEKLTRQCRKLLWVMVVFTVAWVNLKVFQRGGRKQHKHMYLLLELRPCCQVTLNLNQTSPTFTTLYLSALSRALLHFSGTTFVESAVYMYKQIYMSTVDFERTKPSKEETSILETSAPAWRFTVT